MTDRPIIFSAPMIRALLAGRKTQARRLAWRDPFEGGPGDGLETRPSPWQRVQPGDRLWVREAWRTEARHNGLKPLFVPTTALVSYDADYLQEPNDGCRGQTRVAIHMPRWASRLTLTVTDVRVQKARDISEADAEAEGVRWWDDLKGFSVNSDGSFFHGGSPSEAWWQFFSYLHRPKTSTGDISDWVAGRPTWNPEVVALTFTVAQRNIDAGAA